MGGTTEASALAGALAEQGDCATLSYAGRVAQPGAQPITVRIGGFGGVPGLAHYLQSNEVTHVVDATHPFAARMSCHAVAACEQVGVPLLAFTRDAWHPGHGDHWQSVADLPSAATALSGPPKRVMLAVGRMHLATFTCQPQHHYILRLVDEPDGLPPLPHHTTIVARGPFDVAGDIALLRKHRVNIVVCKNAGGSGAQAKLHAARTLGLPVLMVRRPLLPARQEVTCVADVLKWLQRTHGCEPVAHLSTSRGAERGV